ncbi:hypothetical protein Dvina_19180 [Dactylosporangium vinaceum]|uniref:DUF1579 domain-containing protein n=1 Tax=Dactylosporangium vinaceum TaxID=53362 RepID=A0ABV5M9D1_9ACTN|nr:hypothetical protein [Dactylosporangium vinaceum]UAB99986.1 hypothetical protein Dvina_19180 [Dactylosporangium vinaceum]
MNDFAPLLGNWRTRVSYLTTGRVAEGSWTFVDALDGRAVLDEWRVGPEIGLCVRIWDERLRLWRFTFHSTATSVVIHMYARTVRDEIVLERAEADRLERWVFHTIQPDTFRWRSDVAYGGAPWQTIQTVEAVRAARTTADDDSPLGRTVLQLTTGSRHGAPRCCGCGV